MLEAPPGTPVHELPVGQRIEAVAIEMLGVDRDEVVGVATLHSWAIDLGVAVADLNEQAEQEPPKCGHDGKGREEPCDRPHGHGGDHSWATGRLRRLMSDYEQAATVELPAVLRKLTEADVQINRQAKALAAWEAMPRWRRRPKPDRG